MSPSLEMTQTFAMPWKTDGVRTVAQAFPYQGSKRQLASQILSLLPDGGIPHLVEPFAGSAAISMAARYYGLARNVSISDVNAPLMALWGRIIDDVDGLVENYEHVATKPERRIDLVFQGDEVVVADKLRQAAHEVGETITRFVKSRLL